MGKIRKQFGKEYKAKVALEAMKGLKTIAELSSEYGVHVNQISKWKRQLRKELPGIFSRNPNPESQQQEELIDRLYRQIGQLQVENDWFKKKLPL